MLRQFQDRMDRSHMRDAGTALRLDRPTFPTRFENVIGQGCR